VKQPTHYEVRRGDTLYSIAWRFQLDPHGLARANAIAPPYTIFPGQGLRLVNQLAAGQRVLRPRAQAPKPTQAQRSSVPQPRPSSVPKATPRSTVTSWTWPLSAAPSREFSRTSKGIDFAQVDGDGPDRSVRAAGAGEVVYSGNGIGGFERLVIIKHTQSLLTAYSFDGGLQVSEGAKVKAGEPVADIKATGRSRSRLHFELRRDGQPIDPRSVLPKR